MPRERQLTFESCAMADGDKLKLKSSQGEIFEVDPEALPDAKYRGPTQASDKTLIDRLLPCRP